MSKSLGPANDDIPADEMSLAYLLQSAWSRGLGWCRLSYYTDSTGRPCAVDRARACCAQGAAQLDPGPPVYPSSSANDNLDYDVRISSTYYRSVQLGHAFRAAMTDEGV